MIKTSTYSLHAYCLTGTATLGAGHGLSSYGTRNALNTQVKPVERPHDGS